MFTVLLLTEKPVLLEPLVVPLRARVGGEVYYTSPSRLAVMREDEFAAIMASDDILADYEDQALEAIGQRRDTVHTCTVEFRSVTFLRELLVAVQPEVGMAWVDNDHGVILTLAEFIARVERLDDVRKL